MSALTVTYDVGGVWLLLPPTGIEVQAWAGEFSGSLAAAAGFLDDEAAIEQTRALLTHYAELEMLPDFAARFLFAPDIRQGAVLFSVSAVPARSNSANDQARLLGLDGLGEFSGQLDDLRGVGIDGFQLLRVDQAPLMSANGPDEQELVATLATTIRRPLLRNRDWDLVAVARSTNVGLVAAAVLPVLELLSGEDLAQLLGG